MKILHIDDGCECINGSVGVISTYIVGSIGVIPTQIKGTANIIDTIIRGSVGIICTPNTEVYLFVEPEVIWLTPDTMSADFMVRSNTKWIIE